MQFHVMTEPQQGGTYDDILAVAKLAESLGFDGFFRSDHLERIGPGDPGPGSTEAWATLAGLARETTRIRLGTMVTPASFRLPGVLAIQVATVDAMSAGRVELGFGTGWFEQEHRSYGIPFLAPQDRFDAFEEQLEVVTGLWSTPLGETFSYDGERVTLEGSPALPKPVQSGGIPIIIGGAGVTRTPALAARYAAEFNMPPSRSLSEARQQFDRVRRACEDLGRDPGSLRLSTVQTLAIGDVDEVRRYADANDVSVEDLHERGLAGSAAQIEDKVGELAELGAERTYLQLLNLSDASLVERFAAELPQLLG